MSRSIARLAGLGASELECLDRANNTAQVRAIDSVIHDLNVRWKPTGYYRPADIEGVLKVLADEAASAGAAIASAPNSTGDSLTVKRMAFDDLLTKYKDRSKTYERALASARSSGATAIDAPAFKEFVIGSMRAISDAYVTAAVLHCQQSWLESVLDRGYRSVAAIGAVAAGIIGVVVEVGERVVSAAEGLGKLLVFVAKWAPYAAAGLGGFFLYTFARRHGVRGFIPKRFRRQDVAGLLTFRKR